MQVSRKTLARPASIAASVVASVLLAGPVAAHGPAPAEGPSVANVALGWTFEPTVAIPLAVLAIGWLVMVDRIDRRHPGSPVPVGRTLAFMAGLATIAIALMSGIARYDTTLFSVHMVEHLLLMLVAAPLLVLAAPITQVLRAASPRVRRRVLLPILQSTPVNALGQPIVAWLSFTLVLYISHFSPLFEAALEDQFVHDLEHVLYLTAALLFWWPVMALDPAPHRLSHPARAGFVLTQMPLSSFLAMAVLFNDSALYPHYAALAAPYGISALADQQLAAGIMWIASDAVFISAILLIVAGWMRHEERDASAADRRAEPARRAIAERADRLAERTGRYPVRPVPGEILPREPQGAAGTGERSSSR